MKLRLRVPTPKDKLRSHLQSAIDNVVEKLPPYNKTQLLDDLCFLLRSNLFLYIIGPRLRRVTAISESKATGFTTPNSLVNGHDKDSTINTPALNIRIAWDGSSWATQLRCGDISLIEGRQYKTTQSAGFAPSFHWFCEEARFLSYEIHAREQIAMVAPDTGVEVELPEVEGDQTRTRSQGKKERRVVKLKIRYKMVRGKPTLAKKAR